MNNQTISCKYCNKPHDDKIGCPEMKARFSLLCAHCLPPKPVSEHKSLNGVFVHERTDCPEDTMYMVKEENFKVKPEKSEWEEEFNRFFRSDIEHVENQCDHSEACSCFEDKIIEFVAKEKKKSALEALERVRKQMNENYYEHNELVIDKSQFDHLKEEYEK